MYSHKIKIISHRLQTQKMQKLAELALLFGPGIKCLNSILKTKQKKFFFKLLLFSPKVFPLLTFHAIRRLWGWTKQAKNFAFNFFLKEIWIDEKKITYGYVYLVKSTYTSVVCLCHNCKILKLVYPISQRVFLNVW